MGFLGRSSVSCLIFLATSAASIASTEAGQRRLRRQRIKARSAATQDVVRRECREIVSFKQALRVLVRNFRRSIGLLDRAFRARRIAKVVERKRSESVHQSSINDLADADCRSAIDPIGDQMLTRSMNQRIGRIRDVPLETRPACAVAFLSQTCISTLVAARKLDMRVVVSERNDPAKRALMQPWDTLRKPPIVVPIGSRRIHTARSNRFRKSSRLRSCATRRISSRYRMAPRRWRSNPCSSAARPVEQKGIGIAISAFAQIAGKLPAWTLGGRSRKDGGGRPQTPPDRRIGPRLCDLG